jgi:Tfp pilus assembly protein PilO
MLGKNETTAPEVKISTQSRSMPLIGAFMILVSVAVFVFLVKPIGNKVDELQVSVIGKTQELNAMKERIKVMENSKTEYGLTNELQKMEVENSVPVGVRQDGAITDLVNLAKDNNIDLTSIGFGKGGTDKEKIGSLQISAGFDGTYEDLIAFLKDLEQNRRMFKVNSISVQLVDTDVIGFKRAIFSLAMETFYQE